MSFLNFFASDRFSQSWSQMGLLVKIFPIAQIISVLIFVNSIFSLQRGS